MEIQHVIHRHPLSFSFIHKSNRARRCRGCRMSLSGPTYGCEPCGFFIHKSCLNNQKAEVQSFFHLCPLTIFTPTYAFSRHCFVCFKAITLNLSYKCKLNCWFETHIKCALKPIKEYSDECTIQHFTHAHPLKLVDPNQKDYMICSICEELCSSSSSSSSSTYGCMECKFFLHKSCMNSIPRQLVNHCIHLCSLIFITCPYGRLQQCDCCGKRFVRGIKFSCGACDLNLHVKCALLPTTDSEDAKEIQHLSHPHTLALVQNDEEYGSEPRCVACAQICLAPAPTFRCSGSCSHFFLHKSCYVKLPYESYKIKHPFHPKHPLTITSLPYNDHIRTCDACFGDIDSTLLSFSCQKSECKFNLHLDCYKVLPSIMFTGHQHLLTLLEKTPNLSCHLCGVNCCNFVLRCVPCDMNIHLQCLPSAPKTIKHKSHLHPLTLTKSPFEYELNSDEEDDGFYCDVCEQKRNQKEFIYYCVECKFIAEVKCVVSEVLPFKDRSFEEEISKDNITETEIQKWHVENLQVERIKLRERREELEAKMKLLKGELDDVTEEIEKMEDLMLVRGSSWDLLK